MLLQCGAEETVDIAVTVTGNVVAFNYDVDSISNSDSNVYCFLSGSSITHCSNIFN
jgi:hypothetical protein